MEQEVGGSSPPNCTTTVELPRTLSILLIDLTYLRRRKYNGAYKWQSGWLGLIVSRTGNSSHAKSSLLMSKTRNLAPW